MNQRNNNGKEINLNDNFNIIESNNNYTLIFEEKTGIYTFLTPIDKENNKYITNIKCRSVEKLKNGNYIVKIRRKKYNYNPNEDIMIGDFHDVIYEFEFSPNNYLLGNIDYVNYQGRCASIESITNYDGVYLGNCYNKFSNEYYDANKEHIYGLVKKYKTKLKTLHKK